MAKMICTFRSRKKSERIFYLVLMSLFLVMAVFNIFRIILGFESQIFGLVFPTWVSFLLVIFAVYFANRSLIFYSNDNFENYS